MKNKGLRYTENSGEKYLAAFILGAVIFLTAVIPVMICEKGYFIYEGDYLAQQIPFYNLANDTVRNGSFGWNWLTDLGSDFMTSYSFYLFGSPFFWLSAILPRALVTYSMPFLLAMKHGFASLTSYIYIRRFVRSKEASLTGALLYAFSGFQIYNVFFNHFHDVTAFFPLMLISMEENICSKKRGFFALTVALMACINYYFFAGEAVFLVIYFFVRCSAKDFPVTVKSFFGLFFEALAGTAAAAFILLPSALALLGNYRISEHLSGYGWIFYGEKSRILHIIQSFFMQSDTPGHPNLFRCDTAKWASVGGYMPLFSMTGVITFLRRRKKHWASVISWICILCAFVPILNSMFQTFNSSYYARWFFMPLLIFALITAQSLDDSEADFRPAIYLTGAVLLAFGLISLIPEKKNEKLSWFTLPEDFLYFWLTLIVAALSLVLAAFIIKRRNSGAEYGSVMVYSTAALCVVCLMTTVYYCAVTPQSAKNYISKAVNGDASLPEEFGSSNFFRTDISEGCDNYTMIWGVPNIRCFQSVVTPSIMQFYDSVGIQRDVATRPDVTHYVLRGLLSVKYFYREIVDGWSYSEMLTDTASHDKSELYGKTGLTATKVDITKELPGFRYLYSNDNFEIYENELYIPVGFGYDTYISEAEAESKTKIQRENALLGAVVLNDGQIEKYSDILTKADESVYSPDKNAYIRDCREKQQNSSESFEFDSRGFESRITLDKSQLVFFSVPYSDGWSAEVNGKKAEIERVSYGFMAVKAEKGTNVIHFTYHTPGLETGIIISVSAAGMLALYMLFFCFYDRKHKRERVSHSYDYNPCQIKKED